MPFLFVFGILALMIAANKRPASAAGVGALSKAGALRRHTCAPIYDIGEEVLVPRYGDWGVIEESRYVGDTWVYGVSISHGNHVRARECDLREP